MKKFGRFFVAALCFVSMSFAAYAQDAEQATELYNKAATALNEGNKAGALADFEKALTMAKEAGEAGAQIVTDCQGIIPKILLQIGKDEVGDKKMDAAVASVKKAATVATEYGETETANEANKLIPQVIFANGNNLLNAGKFAEAAAEYKKVIELDPKNGVAYLRLGMALTKVGDKEGAAAAFAKASENGQKANVDKQLSTAALKEAQTAFKAAKYAEAIAACNECLAIGENPGARYFLAMSYVKTKEYPKACVELKKIQTNPKYKAAADQLIPQLQCK